MKALGYVAVALSLVACRKASETEVSAKPTPAVDGSTRAGAPPDARRGIDASAASADCASTLGPIVEKVDRVFLAQDRAGLEKLIRADWAAVPETCRKASWYGAAAAMLRPPTPHAFEAPGVRLDDRGQALTAALALPADLGTLRLAVFVSALDGGPAVPATACDDAQQLVADVAEIARGRARDDAAYVCGHVELAQGRGAEAEAQFAAITVPEPYLDLDLRRADAAILRGDRAAAVTFAKSAKGLDSKRAAKARSWDADRLEIIEAAERVLDEANRK